MSDDLTIHAHPDSKGIFVPLWVIDLVDGDHAAAFVLSQVMWWLQPSPDGTPRARYQRDEERWLLRPDSWWWDEARLTVKQVRRVRSLLVAKGFVECRRFKRDGAPTSAWRPLKTVIAEARRAIRPNPELPSEGQFHGSDPGGAVPSDPQGSVPFVFKRTEEENGRRERTNARVDPSSFFDAFWDTYPNKRAKGTARTAFAKALAKTSGDPEPIIAGATRYRDDPNRDPAFTAHASSWLNAERWEDDPLPARNRNGHNPNGADIYSMDRSRDEPSGRLI